MAAQREVLQEWYLEEFGINGNGYVLYIHLLHRSEQCSGVVLLLWELSHTLFTFFFPKRGQPLINL